MISFKGRVSFKQYIKDKPNPWGIKAYALAESGSGYMYNLLIYYGKVTILTAPSSLNQTTRVVLTLATPILDKGYDIYTDWFYTSPEVAEKLLIHTTTITGTVQSNCQKMPAEVKGEINGYRLGDMIVLEWMDKRKVLMFSIETALLP